MIFLIPTLSIVVLTGAVWLFNRITSTRVCPICAGVALTWIWMFVVSLAGYAADQTMLGILMGGSVVGVAYQADKRLLAPRAPNLFLVWKTLFLASGFLAVYALLGSQWGMFALAFAVVAGLFTFAHFLWRGRGEQNKNVEQLEKAMDDCCS